MAIVLPGENANVLRPLDAYTTPFGRYLSAKFGQQMSDNPSVMAFAAAGVADEASGQRSLLAGMSGGLSDLGLGLSDVAPGPAMVQASEARDRARKEGVHLALGDEPIAESALASLIDRQHERVAREQAIAGSPSGARSVAGFGASLAAGVLDPLNIGAAFVPVVGPARYTAMLAEASGLARVGIRGGVGALEGGVGTALLEPATYGLHGALGDDYHLADSLLNIAFGSALGGGLHVGLGTMGDLLKRASPEARQEAMRVAQGQANSGEHINVEPILKPEGVDLQAAGRAQGAPENVAGADVPAARAADEMLAKEGPAMRATAPDERLQAAQAELALAQERLAQVKRGLEPEVAARYDAELAPHQAAIAEAEGYARAARAAALCLTGA